MKKLFYVCLALAVAVPVQLAAQRTQPLSLDRIFESPEFVPQRFGPARWLKGGSYTTVEPSRSNMEVTLLPLRLYGSSGLC